MSVLYLELARSILSSCQIVCWLGICKDLKTLSQTLQGWTLSLSCICTTTLIPSSNYMSFLKTALDIFRSRCRQIKTSLHVLLKDDSCLQGNVADYKADHSACNQLGQVSVLQLFLGMAGFMDHQHVFRKAGLSWKVLAALVLLFWQTAHGGKW